MFPSYEHWDVVVVVVSLMVSVIIGLVFIVTADDRNGSGKEN